MTKAFGEEVKRMRIEAGLSLIELSDKTGINRSSLYRIETGFIADPSVDTLNALARAFDVDAEELYDLAWQTSNSGPGLPSLPTYFRAKYDLEDDEIAEVQRAIEKINKKKRKQP